MNDEIRLLESKFLDFRTRSREDSPARSLTPEERLQYADYLESKGEIKGAEYFRTYVEPKESVKRRPKSRKAQIDGIEVEVFASDGEKIATIEIGKAIKFIKAGERLFVQGTKRNTKKKFYETTTKWNLEEKDDRLFVWTIK